ncbi:hypothetical protein V6R21_32275 [Limibacter armeniacum]|uniref:hypothetical protein n=1 Tax=Limibacter armeniacum TaxID=466084 RepID=UPI002FE5B691
MSAQSIYISENGAAAYIGGGVNALVKTNIGPTSKTSSSSSSGNTEIAHWGKNNLRPQEMYEDVSRSTILKRTLEWKAKALYAGGMVYGVTEIDDKGNETFIRKQDKEVEEWLKRTNFKRMYLFPACLDYFYYHTVFPELIMGNGRNKIANINRIKAAWCRWGLIKSGPLKKCYINPDWKAAKEEDQTIVDVINVEYDPIQSVKDSKADKLIYPLSFPAIDEEYYPLPAWDTVRKSGWYEVAMGIPEFKKAALKNQLTPAFHIEIAKWWWEDKYEEWGTMSTSEKVATVKKEMEWFTETMTGTDNAMKAIMTATDDDGMGNIRKGWTITPIDNKLKDGAYIEDSQEASSHTLFAAGVHPTLIGSTPGKQMGNAGGSEQRVAFNNYILTSQPDQDIILEPVQFIFDYNGWEYEVKFKNSLINKLDSGAEVTEKTNS